MNWNPKGDANVLCIMREAAADLSSALDAVTDRLRDSGAIPGDPGAPWPPLYASLMAEGREAVRWLRDATAYLAVGYEAMALLDVSATAAARNAAEARDGQ